MDEDRFLPRSPELMSPADTGLLVIDVQQRLIDTIAGGRQVAFNVLRLIEAAEILGLPVAATERDRQTLGPIVAELAERLGEVPSRLTLSCGGSPQIFHDLEGRGVHKLLVCGIEAHVSVQQSVLDLLAGGWRVYVAADAVGSRFEQDCRIALGRMDCSGATLTSTRAAMFEWCGAGGTAEFAEIDRLADREGPQSE
jgi:nicotinamidase-related amidase